MTETQAEMISALVELSLWSGNPKVRSAVLRVIDAAKREAPEPLTYPTIEPERLEAP